MMDSHHKNILALTQTVEDFNLKLHKALVKVEQLQNSVSGLTQMVTTLQNMVNQLRVEVSLGPPKMR